MVVGCFGQLDYFESRGLKVTWELQGLVMTVTSPRYYWFSLPGYCPNLPWTCLALQKGRSFEGLVFVYIGIIVNSQSTWSTAPIFRTNSEAERKATMQNSNQATSNRKGWYRTVLDWIAVGYKTTFYCAHGFFFDVATQNMFFFSLFFYSYCGHFLIKGSLEV